MLFPAVVLICLLVFFICWYAAYRFFSFDSLGKIIYRVLFTTFGFAFIYFIVKGFYLGWDADSELMDEWLHRAIFILPGISVIALIAGLSYKLVRDKSVTWDKWDQEGENK